MANINDLKPVKYLRPFTKFCMTIGNLPTSYVESMTYYEQIVWFIKFLEDTVIPTINNNGEAVAELQQNVTDFENNMIERQTNYETNLTNLFNNLKDYVDNYFTNLDVQEEINNKLDGLVEDGTLERIVGNYIDKNIIRIYSSIQELKADTEIQKNIKVKTLGYYNINDGGSSLYYIREKLEDETTDNGSLILLDNGFVAELIVENSTVNYKQFGAKLDGTDDHQAIIDCHNFANKFKFNVIGGAGTLLCNFTVDVKTNFDGLGLNYIIDDNTPFGIYNIVSETQIEDYEYNEQFETNQIENFNDFKNKFFVITKEDETYMLGKRQGLETETYYHRQPIAVDGTARLLSSPFYLGNIGTFTIKYEKDLYEQGVIFKNCHIITTLTKIGFPHFIRCTRNNCIIENMTVENTTYPSSDENYSYGLINIIGCANTTIRNIVAQNNSTTPNIAHSYVLDITESFNVVLDNLMLAQGWGAIATHFCDTVKCVNSVINRFDNHYGCFGTYMLTNSTLEGVGQCCAGYGNADFIIDKVVSNGYGTNQLFYTRNDFNITFSGILKVKDVKFYNLVSRIVLYQLGTGTANTNLSIGTFTLKVYNVNLPNNAIQYSTSTTGDTLLYLYNCEIMPYASTTAQFVSLYAYNCTLRNIASLKPTELYNCKCVSFRNQDYQGTTSMMIFGGTISPTIDIATLKVLITGVRIYNNITCDSIVIVGSYKTGTSATITANSKHVEGCYNIT